MFEGVTQEPIGGGNKANIGYASFIHLCVFSDATLEAWNPITMQFSSLSAGGGARGSKLHLVPMEPCTTGTASRAGTDQTAQHEYSISASLSAGSNRNPT